MDYIRLSRRKHIFGGDRRHYAKSLQLRSGSLQNRLICTRCDFEQSFRGDAINVCFFVFFCKSYIGADSDFAEFTAASMSL